MADLQKVTKVNYLGPSPSLSCPYPVVVTGINVTPVPPEPLQYTVCNMSLADLDDPDDLRTKITAWCTAEGIPLPDWTL